MTPQDPKPAQEKECRFCTHFHKESLDPASSTFFNCDKNRWPPCGDAESYPDLAKTCSDFKWGKLLGHPPQEAERCPQCDGESEEIQRNVEEWKKGTDSIWAWYKCKSCRHGWMRTWDQPKQI